MIVPWIKESGWSPLPGATVNYFTLGLGFMFLEQCFEVYIMTRQRRVLQKTEPPAELLEEAANVDKSLKEQIQDKFNTSREYNLDRSSFGMFKRFYTTSITFGGFFLGMGPILMELTKGITSYLFPSYVNEYTITGVLLLVQSVMETIIGLPISYYNTFVIEEKHGFNKMTLKLFFSDMIKQALISNLIAIPFGLVIIKLIRTFPDLFYIYVWLFVVVFSLIMVSIYPNFIAPLFNKYEALKDKELKKKIDALAEEVNFPLTKLYQVDGSKRSAHSNAYLYGFFKDKRIVLYDTLFTPEKGKEVLCCNDDEILGILAHEIGHWKYSHTLKGFFLQQGIFFVIWKLAAGFINDPFLYNHYGYVPLESKEYPLIVGITLFSILITPLGTLAQFFVSALTRKFEYEADSFALSLGRAHPLKTGLLKISISNLSSFEVDSWYHMYTASHPTLLERLQKLRSDSKKKQ